MVARDVDDWDEDSNTYNASIELYKHDSKIVGVCDVTARPDIFAIDTPAMY